MSDETTSVPSRWKRILLALANDPGVDQRDAAADELATELADARTELQKQDAELERLRKVNQDGGRLITRLKCEAAALDTVRTLATNATRTGCGAGWTLDPAEVLAALNQPAESKET